jgi:hypothetical protein
VTKDITSFSMSRRLRSICGVPIDIEGGGKVTLTYEVDRKTGAWFSVNDR